MSDDGSPRVFVTYSHDSPEHKDQVRQFATFLRTRTGLDVQLDQWYDHKRIDWSLWALERLKEADYVLVIASPDYKRRADGEAAPHEGRGAQFEAAMLRDGLTRDLRAETGRILPVVLPGRSITEIPTFLNAYSTTRFEIDEVSDAGVAGLVSAITGVGSHAMPERGKWPHASTEVPLTEGPQWTVKSPGLRVGKVLFDGVNYPNSVVHRPSAHGRSRGFVEVNLGGRYTRLTAVVGVPDDAQDAFQVGRFVVHVDGHIRADTTAAPGRPVTVDVNLTGANLLRLEMYRPATAPSPQAPTPTGHSRRLPELAWGSPMLS